MDLLSSVINGVLFRTTEQVAGEVVRYHARADGEVYDVIATRAGHAGQELNAEGNLVIVYHEMTFKIRRTALPVMPMRNDQIEWATTNDDGSERTEWFQVLSDGSDYIEPNNTHRDRWELHCKWIPDPGIQVQPIHGNAAGAAYGNPQGGGYGGASG